jgi:hypothetical protein
MHTAQKNFNEAFRGLFQRKRNKIHVAEVQGDSVVIHRSQKSQCRNVRAALAEGPFALPPGNIITQEPEKRTDMLLAIMFRQLMAFERRMKPQAQKIGIPLIMSEYFPCDEEK